MRKCIVRLTDHCVCFVPHGDQTSKRFIQRNSLDYKCSGTIWNGTSCGAFKRSVKQQTARKLRRFETSRTPRNLDDAVTIESITLPPEVIHELTCIGTPISKYRIMAFKRGSEVPNFEALGSAVLMLMPQTFWPNTKYLLGVVFL